MSQVGEEITEQSQQQVVQADLITFQQEDIKQMIEKQKQPRCFTKSMKELCWKHANIMQGRHPDRWRIDAVGNPVLRGLTSCTGPLCYEYDHIVAFSKGGKTEVSNCQLLQTIVNKYKSNKTNISQDELLAVSPTHKFTGTEFDAVERAIYGDILCYSLNYPPNISKQSIQIINPQKDSLSMENAQQSSPSHDINQNSQHNQVINSDCSSV